MSIVVTNVYRENGRIVYGKFDYIVYFNFLIVKSILSRVYIKND